MTAESISLAANEIARERGVPFWRALMMVLLSSLKSVELPPEVHPALKIAQRHWWSSNGDQWELSEAKLICWTFLERVDPGQSLATPEARHVRALLCVLEPDGDDEKASLTAEWFAEMVDEKWLPVRYRLHTAYPELQVVKLTTLSNFLSGYLHQDWDTEYEDGSSAGLEFARTESPHDVLELIADLEELLSTDWADEEIEQWLVVAGCYYLPPGSPRAWLGELHQVISAEQGSGAS